jgi:carbon monoxide dehydrogenase subunit G
MLKKALFGLLALVGVVLVAAVLQPDDFRVERQITVQAPPEKVFALVDDFRQWPAWSPWEKLDPAMKRTLGGPATGKGATYAWEGNADVGRGRMEITDSAAPSRVAIKLDFIEPFASSNTTEFSFDPAGAGTRVIWVMRGPMPFISKLMSLFVSMDRMIGKDFEAGLANLKATAER